MKTLFSTIITMSCFVSVWNLKKDSDDRECVRICRNSTKDIKCDSDEIITINDVIFTSQSKKPASCFLVWVPGDICDNEISYKDIQDKCNGKQRCSVKMTYNPCTREELKYSKIVYTCTEDDETPPKIMYPLVKSYTGSKPVTSTGRPTLSIGLGLLLTSVIVIIIIIIVCGIHRRTKKPVDNSREPYNNDQLYVIYNAPSTRYSNPTYADVGQGNDILISSQSDLPTYEEATLGMYEYDESQNNEKIEGISDQTCHNENDHNDKKVKKGLRETDI